jgi:hypothetical protein
MTIDLLIIVEGKSDLEFVRDFILINFINSKIKKKESLKILIEYDKKNIEIRICRKEKDNNSTGGKGNLIHIKDIIKSELQNALLKKVIIIFDADNDFKKSNAEICSLVDKEFIFELFLMPNHTLKQNGDLETLILDNCINKTEFHDCFGNFKICLKTKNFDITCLDLKTKLYNYFEVNSQNPKLDNRDYKIEAFNLIKDEKHNSKYELFEFINKNL